MVRGHCFTVVRVNEIMNTGTVPHKLQVRLFLLRPRLCSFPIGVPPQTSHRYSSAIIALVGVLWTSSPSEDLLEEIVFKSREQSVEKGLLDGRSFRRLRAGCGRGGLSCNGAEDKGWGVEDGH